MAWKLLKTDYTDAVWAGLKKYINIDNGDGTVSLKDVTDYTNKENSFFGAKDANQMNYALNTLMSMVENGTNLYEDFLNYFDEQKIKFSDYTDMAKVQYSEDIANFEDAQEILFQTWFDKMKGQLSTDAAGSLQSQIDAHASENVASEAGVHNLRYFGDILQYKNGEAWGNVATGRVLKATLTVGAWTSGKTLTLSNPFLQMGDYMYTIAPTEVAVYGNHGIYADQITSEGKLVFHCRRIPNTDIHIDIIKQGVM